MFFLLKKFYYISTKNAEKGEIREIKKNRRIKI